MKIFLSLLIVFTIGFSFTAQNKEESNNRAGIHICDVQWSLDYHQARRDGCNHEDATSYANTRRLECYANLQ